MKVGRRNVTWRNRIVRAGKWCLLAVGLCLISEPAFAYIDPNSSSILFQLLAPLATAVAAAFVFLRNWIRSWFQALIPRREATGKQRGETDI
jgi:hypothetical protein